LDKGPKGWVAKALLHYMRQWDVRTANGVDQFVANSEFIARRIEKAYRREATVVFPPVNVSSFEMGTQRDDFYLAASRLVPYKRMDLIVRAFSGMPGKRLVVIGDGPEADKIKSLAGPNVEVLGYQPFDVLKDHLQRARAFVFAAEEDFGILPVEAQACGTPVIAFGKGGAVETVIDGETGIHFSEQDSDSLCAAVQRFEQEEAGFDYKRIRRHSFRFSVDNFRRGFASVVHSALERSRRRKDGSRRLLRMDRAGTTVDAPRWSSVADD
jgi:glycosyltransferase involved in cell wall biosynthesis